MGKHKPKKDKAEKQAARRHGKSAKTEEEEINEETAAQVKEIEGRLSEIHQEIKTSEAGMRRCAIEAKRATLTRQEMEHLPDNTTMYRQVGKMFLNCTKHEMSTSLQATVALKTVESQQLKQKQSKLDMKLKSEAEGLRDLLGPERMKKLLAEGGLGKDATKTGGTNPESTAGTGSASGLGAVPEDSVLPIWGKANPDAKKVSLNSESAEEPSTAETDQSVTDQSVGCTTGEMLRDAERKV